MKIINKTKLTTIKQNITHKFSKICSDKVAQTLSNTKNWEMVKPATTATVLASLAFNSTVEDYESSQLRDYLSKRELNYKELGVKKPFYTKDDIDLIIKIYKSNPKLVEKLINMEESSSIMSSPRFRATSIKNIVSKEPENPRLLNKIVDAATIKDGKVVEYSYFADDILTIMDLSKENPELIERLVDQKKYYTDGSVTSRFKHIFAFEYMIKAYSKNPTVVDDLLNYDELIAREIADIATLLSPELYNDLKQTIPSESSDKALYIKKYADIIRLLKTELKDMDMNQKSILFLMFNEILSKSVINIYRKHYPQFDSKMNQLKMALGGYKDNISTNTEKQKLFVNNILVNNNPETEEFLKTFDFTQYGKTGLSLKYSRADFVAKINNLVQDLSEEEQDIVLQNFGLIRGHDDFDGLLTNKPFKNSLVSKEAQDSAKEIQKEIELFTQKNGVVSGNQKADEILTGLVQGLSEFAFFVGKKQHSTHKYSIDIHTLKVLQNVMNNPQYSKLSDKSKTIIKMSVLMHDFGKKGGVRDAGHASLSASYAAAILQKFPFSDSLKNRIIDVIENHHWFENYNKGITKALDVAALCRNPEDILIYEMFAKADLENVNDNFHFQCCSNVKNSKDYETYMKNKMQPIIEKFRELRSKSNFVFDTKFVQNGEKFPRKTVIVKGKPVKLKVLNFNELKAGESLQKYGFAPNVTKENAHFLVHTQGSISQFEDTLKLTQNLSNRVAWSTSLVKNDSKGTVEKFGFIFNTEQANISLGYFKNLSLGHHRNIQNFFNILFLEESKVHQTKVPFYKDIRVFLRDKFLESLEKNGIKLTSKEYAELAEYIISKNFLTQFNKDIQIGNKIIKFNDIQIGLEKARGSLFAGYSHNEVECIMPTVKGLFAKASNLEECPSEFIEFAAKYDLPIVLM